MTIVILSKRYTVLASEKTFLHLFLESIIGECSDVKCIQIIGIPDHKLGAVGVAFIETAETNESCRDRILAWINDNLASYQIPKHFVYMTEKDWPFTTSGKINKSALRERFLASQN